jgi:hypothetical protein
MPKALLKSHLLATQPTSLKEKVQGQSNAVVPEQVQRSEPKQTVAPTYQSFASQGSGETSMPEFNMVDYSSMPKAFKKSHLLAAQSAPTQQKAQGQSKGSSAPTRIAQSDLGMDDNFWLKALAGAGLAIWKGGEYIITGSEKAVEDLYRSWARTHQGTTNPQQVLQSTKDHGGGKNAQHGRAENQPSKEQQLEDYKQYSGQN